jgi:hypothetical protein
MNSFDSSSSRLGPVLNLLQKYVDVLGSPADNVVTA